jgi:hypothetical protein
MRISFVLLFAAVAFAQNQNNPGAVFRSGVSLVRVDVEAIGTGGRVVTGLTKDDFRVSDEGTAQSLVNFSFEEEPLDLILLFDTAGSMHGKLLNVVRATELGFNELHKGDRVCVRAFGPDSIEVQPFTDNLQAVNEAILIRVLQLKFGGSSRIGPAADEAALRFRNEPKTRRKRAVLIITDKTTDKPGAREPNEAAIVHDLWNSDAVLSELILNRGQNGANGIVEKTGGATIVAASNPGEAFRDSVHYLRSGYTMYYSLPAAQPGAERTLDVALTAEAAKKFPNVKIRARSGYIVP